MEKTEEKIEWSEDRLAPEKPGLVKRWALIWLNEHWERVSFLSSTEHQAVKRYNELVAQNIKPITLIRYIGTDW